MAGFALDLAGVGVADIVSLELAAGVGPPRLQCPLVFRPPVRRSDYARWRLQINDIAPGNVGAPAQLTLVATHLRSAGSGCERSVSAW